MYSGLVLSNLHDLAAKPFYSANEQLQNERLDYGIPSTVASCGDNHAPGGRPL